VIRSARGKVRVGGRGKTRSNPKQVPGAQLVVALGRVGFKVERVKGSHYRLKHPDGRATTVPVHANEVIGRGLLHHILKDCEMTKGELAEVL
jgi:predicted RNA binding protein YcfA (HicA-like mRNA interferase family)